MKKVILIILAVLTTSFGIHAQNLQPRLSGFQYIEHANNSSNDLPLLIAFHYSGGTPTETLRDYDSLRSPIRIIIPKGNYRKRNGFSYYPADYYKTDSAAQFAASRTTVDSIASFVRTIEKKFNKKAIVSGISQGGDLALLLAIYHPDLCVASFPFAAVINPQLLTEIKNKKSKLPPIHLYQGEADKIVSVHYTRKKVKELKSIIKINLYTYPGVGHDISPEMKADYSKTIEQLIKR